MLYLTSVVCVSSQIYNSQVSDVAVCIGGAGQVSSHGAMGRRIDPSWWTL